MLKHIIVIMMVPHLSHYRRKPELSLIIWTASPGFGRSRHPLWKSHTLKGASLIFSAFQRWNWIIFTHEIAILSRCYFVFLTCDLLKMISPLCSRLWQMKEDLRWSVRNGAGLAWPSGLATLQAKTSDLCCARTMRGSSTPLKCSNLVPACRYHSTHIPFSFLWGYQ